MFRIPAIVLVVVAAASCSLALQPGWIQGDRVTQDSTVRMRLMLKTPQGTRNMLMRSVDDMADPRSPKYGHYWTRTELCEKMQPTTRALAAATAWVKRENVLDFEFSTCKDSVVVYLSGSVAEALLSVKMFSFSHPKIESSLIRTLDNVVLPAEIRRFATQIIGVTAFPVPRELKVEGLNAPDIFTVTPDVIRKRYSINDTFSGTTKASQAVAEFQGQTYRPADLSKFQSTFDLPAQPVRNINGSGKGLLGHAEANLDIQYIMVTGQKIPSDFWIEKGEGFDLIEWVDQVIASEDSPLVWSISYGEDLTTVKPEYAQKLDQEIAKLATLGVSVLFASGDSGVFSRTSSGGKFAPDFPASLPHVTAVGATTVATNDTEIGVNWSGGGFSHPSYFNRTTDCSYQVDAVNTYFQSAPLPPQDLWERDGCGYPDVAAFGTNYEIILDGFKSPVSGTSASCPNVAGVMALLNDVRLGAGKAPLGWLNPLIYQNPKAFSDVVAGKNSDGTKEGFYAAPGWDPVTGYGSPNYPALRALAISL